MYSENLCSRGLQLHRVALPPELLSELRNGGHRTNRVAMPRRRELDPRLF